MTTETTYLYEYILRVEGERYVCRIWRAHATDDPYPSNEDLKALAATMTRGPASVDAKAVAYNLAQFNRVNSVEVFDNVTREGICVHKNWP